MICLKFYPEYKKKVLVIDGSCACWYELDHKKRPKLINLTNLIDDLRNLGIKKEYIKVFCDASLKYYIDNQRNYFSLKRKKIIQECPAGLKADKFILNYCLNNPNTLIISNDLFREYYNQLPDVNWISMRRIAFMKINEKFIFVPMGDIKLICGGIAKC